MANKTQIFSVCIRANSTSVVDYIDPTLIKNALECALYEQSRELNVDYTIIVSDNPMYRESND